MKFSYGFNPNNEYGWDIAPSRENYNSALPNREDYPHKKIRRNVGFIELFVLVMIIPFWMFLYKFFYLLVLPLIPVSVVVFEVIREVAPLNKLFMFGGSFLGAYLFCHVLKYFFFSLSFGWRIVSLIGLYVFTLFALYFLLGVYPENEVLNGSVVDLENFINFLD